MSRKPRVEYSGAFFHVICRGNKRQTLFHADPDREFYLERLEQYRKRYGFTVYAYVLMSNHVHLLLETGKTPLSKIMQGVQFTYTRYFNRRYHKTGHLFQGRYKAILCDRDSYLRELVRYLHLNPARMRKPIVAGKYRWSSHRAYLGESGGVKVETSKVLGQFGNRPGKARERYLQFMAEGDGVGHQGKYYETVDQRFLGDEGFVEKVGRQVGRELEVEPRVRKVAFTMLLKELAEHYETDAKTITQAGRQRRWVRARSMLAYLGREWSGMSLKELGKRLNRDPSMVSRLYAAYAGNRDQRTENRLIRKIQ